jgi:c-di-GMP-binding flagellar brake protein YcgR
VNCHLAEVLAADDVMGVLVRDVRVRVMNISGSGCLLETTEQLELGTSGSLRVMIGDERYTDDVRAVRVQQVRGGTARWFVGVEFLWTTYPDSRSLRRMVSRLQREIAQQAMAAEFALHRLM